MGMSVEEQTELLIQRERKKRVEAGTEWDHEFEVRAALALNLAKSLDNGAGLAQAAISKEFRAVAASLIKETGGEEDGDGFGDWITGLGVAGASPLGHTP